MHRPDVRGWSKWQSALIRSLKTICLFLEQAGIDQWFLFGQHKQPAKVSFL